MAKKKAKAKHTVARHARKTGTKTAAAETTPAAAPMPPADDPPAAPAAATPAAPTTPEPPATPETETTPAASTPPTAAEVTETPPATTTSPTPTELDAPATDPEVPKDTVHGLGAKSLGTEPAMIGKPDLGLHLTFADLAELKTFFREGIALLQKLLLKAENQAPQLTPEESRCADLMNRMWPPDGKPPPELLGKRKEIETAVIA